MSSVFREYFFKQIHNFSKDNLFCDVTLISSDEECKINAHKMVLAAASKYFQAMFSGSFRESSQKEVKIQIDSESLKLIIKYIYTASIELSTDSVVEVLKNAHLFELETLINECCDFMGRNLNISNCLETARIADVYNLINLYEKSENYICDKFGEVRKENNEFLNLDCDILNKLLSSNKIQLESEEEVFYCIQSWVDHDRDNRTICYDRLLHSVRLPLLNPVFITNVIQKACESTECKMLINKTLQWHLLPELRPVLFSEKLTQPRYSKHTLLAISGWASEDNLDVLSVGEFSFKLNKWSYATWLAPPKELRNFSANFEYALFNDCLFLAGGHDINKNPTNNVIFFNLKDKIWRQTHKMNRMRTKFGLTATNDFLYAYRGERMLGVGTRSMEKMGTTSAWEIIVNYIKEASPSAASNININKNPSIPGTMTLPSGICNNTNNRTNIGLHLARVLTSATPQFSRERSFNRNRSYDPNSFNPNSFNPNSIALLLPERRILSPIDDIEEEMIRGEATTSAEIITDEYYLTTSQNNFIFMNKVNNKHQKYFIYNNSDLVHPKVSFQVNSSRVLGIGIVRSKEKELLIEVSINSIFKYDLQSGAKHEIPTNKIGEDFKSCKMFDHYVVIFGDTKFQIYYPFIDHWITLPDLDNNHGRVVLIRK